MANKNTGKNIRREEKATYRGMPKLETLENQGNPQKQWHLPLFAYNPYLAKFGKIDPRGHSVEEILNALKKTARRYD